MTHFQYVISIFRLMWGNIRINEINKIILGCNDLFHFE